MYTMAEAGASHAVSRPLNVHQIVERAQNFDYNPLIPLKYWLRTADTLLKEARIYEREGNDQQAYLLLFRHAQLVLGNLTGHPDARSPENRIALAEANYAVNKNLAKLEVLKPRINKRYERYEQLLREREEQRAALANQKGDPYDGCNVSIPHRREPSDSALATRARPVAAEDNRDLAVDLAHREIRRRQTVREAVRRSEIEPEDYTLSQGLQEARRRIDSSQKEKAAFEGRRTSSPKIPSPSIRSSYRYPSVPTKSSYPSLLPSSADRHPPSFAGELKPPVIPPKQHSVDPPGIPPLVPGKLPLSSPSPPSEPISRSSTSTPDPTQPASFTFQPSAYLENGTPLRTIFLPPTLRTSFLDIARPNTMANLETCGILCGTLISNALFISKLVIPEQESTPDTCETINESALFDYCDSEDLMVLGWIHTHPSQTCFMSSRDLHTHCGYQVMMPESIAIVCAPSKEPSWGIFRLTDPPGMKTILNCTMTGLFHPHSETNTYTDALRPGHVFEAKGLEFEVVDLRPGH
ncbi:MAG: hypothetical protein M1819_000538 [Sarea resinae]|nr:MAG: hypothetical protein M1819_000538 [Sarea resinae]